MSLSSKFRNYGKKSNLKKPAGLKPPSPPKSPPKSKTKLIKKSSQPKKSGNSISTKKIEDIADYIIIESTKSSEYKRFKIREINAILKYLGLNKFITNVKVTESEMRKEFNTNMQAVKTLVSINPNTNNSQIIFELKKAIERKNKGLKSIKKRKYNKKQLEALAKKASSVKLGSKKTRQIAQARKKEHI